MNLRNRLMNKVKNPQAVLTEVPPDIIEPGNSEGETEGDDIVTQQQKANATSEIRVVEEETGSTEEFITEHERKYRSLLLETMLNSMDLSRISELPIEEAQSQIQSIALSTIADENYPLNAESRKKITQLIQDEILGLGPIDTLLRDPDISDIMINGAKRIFVEKSGKLQASQVNFEDDAHLMRIIDRIVSQVGRRVDESSPMCDARLKDGSRVNVIVPPLALDGPTMSIRRFPVDRLSLEKLIANESCSPSMATFLMGVVKGRRNIVISGGTGSGKTTMLNAMSSYIPNDERIITIEDAAELQLQQEHLVRLETRPSNVEGKGEITQRELVKNALRMRPDRIVIGEVRGPEAMDMLQAMNTGHDGSITTIHANTPRDALGRIENMVAMNGYELPIKALRSQISSAIDLVIQIKRMEDGGRRIISISEIVGMEGEIITMSEIFKFERHSINEDGKVVGTFMPTGVIPKFVDELRQRDVEFDLDIFNTMNIVRINHEH